MVKSGGPWQYDPWKAELRPLASPVRELRYGVRDRSTGGGDFVVASTLLGVWALAGESHTVLQHRAHP